LLDQLIAAELRVYKCAPVSLRGFLAKLAFHAADAEDFEPYTKDVVGEELDHESQTENLTWRLHRDLEAILKASGVQA
jgi:hypothetical protein